MAHEGTYRQAHEGMPLWLMEDAHVEAFSSVFDDPQYVFAIYLNQTDTYAFCVIDGEYPSREEMLSPWTCNENWWMSTYVKDQGWKWVVDAAFDIDECSHQGVPVENVTHVEYPELLCLASDSQTAYANYRCLACMRCVAIRNRHVVKTTSAE